MDSLGCGTSGLRDVGHFDILRFWDNGDAEIQGSRQSWTQEHGNWGHRKWKVGNAEYGGQQKLGRQNLETREVGDAENCGWGDWDLRRAGRGR